MNNYLGGSVGHERNTLGTGTPDPTEPMPYQRSKISPATNPAFFALKASDNEEESKTQT